jgi:hypothetical protein
MLQQSDALRCGLGQQVLLVASMQLNVPRWYFRRLVRRIWNSSRHKLFD